MSIERNTIQISTDISTDQKKEAYAKDFRELFYGSQKRRARTLFGLFERKAPFPSILTADTLYAILNGVDFSKKRNQTTLINLINGNDRGNKVLRDFLLSNVFELGVINYDQPATTISGITLDDLGLSRSELREELGNEYRKYQSIWSKNRRQWETINAEEMTRILQKKIPQKVANVITQTKDMLNNLIRTDIDFAFNLLSKTPELVNPNVVNLVALAKLNPGAALGILSNPNLQNLIPLADAEIIFANLLNNRDKKVRAMLRTYVINLLNADAAAPEFHTVRAAQLQAFFNHPSRLAEEFKIPRLLLEKYWDEGNFEKTPENRVKFLATNDRNDANNPRKIHWFKNLFAGRDNKFFKDLYQQLVVEIKPAAAAVPAEHEVDGDDHESSVSRDQEAVAQQNAAKETARLAEIEAQRQAAEEAAKLAQAEAERKAAEEAKAKAAKPVISAHKDTEAQTTKVDVAIPGDDVFEALQDQLNAVNAQRKTARTGPHTPPPSSAGKIARSLDDGIPDSAEKKKSTPAHIRRNSDGIPDSVEKPATPTHARRKSFDDEIADSPAKSARAAPSNFLPILLERGRGRTAQPVYEVPTDGSVLVLPPSLSRTKIGKK